MKILVLILALLLSQKAKADCKPKEASEAAIKILKEKLSTGYDDYDVYISSPGLTNEMLSGQNKYPYSLGVNFVLVHKKNKAIVESGSIKLNLSNCNVENYYSTSVFLQQ